MTVKFFYAAGALPQYTLILATKPWKHPKKDLSALMNAITLLANFKNGRRYRC